MADPAATSTDSPGRPTYAERFRCIGPECEDTFCAGWGVPIDRAAWDKYQSLPESPLRDLIHSCVIQKTEEASEPLQAEDAVPTAHAQAVPAATAEAKPPVFAVIKMNEQNQCPMLSADHLCRIQSELGESYLSYTCAAYPRIVASIDGVLETSLALSCPEAARIVLLTPDLLSAEPDARGPAPAGAESSQDNSPQAWFLSIRKVALDLIRNRAYPLWQRMFLLNIFCRRLDSITRGELQRTIPAFLADFESAAVSGALRPSMETLPVDRKAQLDVVLKLAGLMLHKSNVRPRFVECIQAFTKGIGNGPGATLDSLTAHYTFAHERYFAPFFNQHPHILENYLANAILRRQFPLGKEGLRPGAQIDAAREFSMLAAQFALMRGLLIGVAGFHGVSFSAEHVVHTVQAASKHFDHHPKFPDLAHTQLVDSGINDARGFAVLLREPAAGAAGDASMPAVPEKSAQESVDGRSAWASAAGPAPVAAAQERTRPQ